MPIILKPTSTKMIKAAQYLLTSVAFLACATGVYTLQSQHYQQQVANPEKIDYAQQERNLEAMVKLQQQMPSFGFDNLMANWTFLQYVQYFGDTEARDATSYRLIPKYFQAIVEKDPRFIQAYLSLSTTNSLYAGYPDKTVQYLNTVINSLDPQMSGYPFQVWTYKGVDEILFLGNLEAAENSYRMAAEWASQLDDETAQNMVPRYQKTADFLASNPENTQAHIAAWGMILNNARDDRTRQHAIKQLEALGAQVVITAQGELKITMPDDAET